jgi:hypothetical protein
MMNKWMNEIPSGNGHGSLERYMKDDSIGEGKMNTIQKKSGS